MAIPFVDLSRQSEALEPEISQALTRVLASGQYILGPELRRLEGEVAGFLQVPHAIGVASGTEALFLALKGLGIAPGDEVVTTPFCFIAGVEAIAALGAKPVFSDIDPRTFNLNPLGVENKITPQTKAVVVAHLFGLAADMAPLAELCKSHGIYLIEDGCQAFGSDYQGRKVGGLGDAGCFSFYPTKNLGAMGDGGIIVTGNDALALRLKTMRNHGSLNGEDPLQLGWNSRLDEIQAAILQIKLKYIEQWNLRRRRLAMLYHSGLAGCGLRLPIPAATEDSTFQNYTLCTPRRDHIRRALSDHGIGTMIYYPKPLYQIPSVQALLGHRTDPLPETERICQEALSLPLYPELTEAEVETVCQVIRDVTR